MGGRQPGGGPGVTVLEDPPASGVPRALEVSPASAEPSGSEAHDHGPAGTRARGAEEELAAYRRGVAAVVEACRRISAGDLEVRIPSVGIELEELRFELNHLVDVADAFVRESAASLAAAGDGRFYRRFLLQGMPGAFRAGAARTESARKSMQGAADERRAEEDRRGELVARVLDVASQVAAASTEFGASAESLADGAASAVGATSTAIGTVESLRTSSLAIGRAAEFIRSVAAQTKLLSLNATIEAAHAGDAGRGFNVVANEIKSLADEVARSSQDIGENIGRAQADATKAVEAITGISALITEMHEQIAGVAAAAGAGSGTGGGLADLAEHLRVEVSRFASGG
ncbi:MAG: methyl-accepting chemotaxis protein [Actinomycetota bacterium]|nr:methyl-accepting chemotaxis protein [Actinomycetota bacterium]